MKKILYYGLCLSGLVAMTSCGDFLETSTPSETDANFVFSNSETSRAALDGAYESWRSVANGQVSVQVCSMLPTLPALTLSVIPRTLATSLVVTGLSASIRMALMLAATVC